MESTLFDIAEALYNSGCLKFGSFRTKSGALSPYYIDLARLLASPKDLCTVVEIAADKISRLSRTSKIDKLASIELKGALILPSIACRTDLPCVVVRKEEKTYGATGRVAGATVELGDHILFFDDVISEGLSKLEAIKPLEELGAKIENIMVVIDRQQNGKANLERLGYKLHALSKVSDLVKTLHEKSKISREQLNAVLDYIKN